MKKIYAFSKDVKSSEPKPQHAILMAYEEYDGQVQISMHHDNGPVHVIIQGPGYNIWEKFVLKLTRLPEYYRDYAVKISEKLSDERTKEINSTYTPLFVETDTLRRDGWIDTSPEPNKEKENKEMMFRMINQFNLSDLSELVQDRTWFEEALELLNNMGKMYRLKIYINGPTWHTVIADNDSPYPSFSIALHVFLTKIQYYMSMGSKPVEYKDV